MTDTKKVLTNYFKKLEKHYARYGTKRGTSGETAILKIFEEILVNSEPIYMDKVNKECEYIVLMYTEELGYMYIYCEKTETSDPIDGIVSEASFLDDKGLEYIMTHTFKGHSLDEMKPMFTDCGEWA